MIDLPALQAAVAEHGAIARVVIADVTGSAPRTAGTEMLVWPDGFHGTIGGGNLEWQALEDARALLAAGGNRRVDHHALGPALGQCCGGAVTLVIERIDKARLAEWQSSPVVARAVTAHAPKTSKIERHIAKAQRTMLVDGWLIEPVHHTAQPVYIHGAGHVGQALSRILAPMPDLSVTAVDTRPEWRAALPKDVGAASTHTVVIAQAPEHAIHFILTHQHDLDLDICHAVLQRGFGYAGLIGSATKWARFQSRLSALGHSPDQIARITCPIGDPSLGKHPQTIAVSVASALLVRIARQDARGTS